ncbi:MAG: hypothetical protein JWM81_248 [Candidatus Saccharibacteria bacterium]|nr:hypothetical protein [Candidatus Saccharibacteria bacterium]
MSDAEISYFSVMLEAIRDEVKAVHEIVGAMSMHVAKIPHIEKKIAILTADMKTVKYAVKDMSMQQQEHKVRITRLEAA